MLKWISYQKKKIKFDFFIWQHPNDTHAHVAHAHAVTLYSFFQFLTSSSRITADWTRSESRDASGPPSPAPSWRSWSGFLLKHTTRTSTQEKSWLSKSIWLKPECRYAASSSSYARWRNTNISNGTILTLRFKQPHIFFYPFCSFFS